MSAPSNELVNLLEQRILKEIGQPSKWPIWRDGWKRADLALLDAIYSARQKYEMTVRPRVKEWERLNPISTGSELTYLTTLDEAVIRETMGNNYLPGVRISGTRIGIHKSVGVIEVAKSLCNQGLTSSEAIRTAAGQNKDSILQLLRQTKGIGFATSNYFLMLIGVDGVKVDTLLGDWVRSQLSGHTLSDVEVSEVVACAARDRFNVPSTHLDYAIWSFESARRSSSK